MYCTDVAFIAGAHANSGSDDVALDMPTFFYGNSHPIFYIENAEHTLKEVQ
jgi:hypothetical protein